MKLTKTISVFLAIFMVLLAVFPFAVIADESEVSEAVDESVLPDDDMIVTYGYIKEYCEKLKEEILSQSGTGGGSAGYRDVSFDFGTVVVFSADAELILRGGEAVILTSSAKEGYGVCDISANEECFSGRKLELAHIYGASDKAQSVCILVTGERAYFTVKGSYEEN